MIPLHRLTHPNDELFLNPDLVQSVEATPDTVITLATGAKLIVAESPEEVADRVRCWKADILGQAFAARQVAHVGLIATTPTVPVLPPSEPVYESP